MPESLSESLPCNLREQRVAKLMEECQKSVLDQIIGPFGLSMAMFDDKDGGEVTTLHNFNNGIVATEEDKKRYDTWKDEKSYDHKNYEKGFSGPDGKRKKVFQSTEGKTIKDGYTGKDISKDGQSHLDHVTSAKEIHSDPKNHLFMNSAKRVDMAVDDKNLVMTDGSLNQSKQERKLDEWMNGQHKKSGLSNAEHFEVDKAKARQAQNKSEAHIRNTQIKEQVKKQGLELISTGAHAATRMAIQQAIGIVLKEFAQATFVELRLIFRKGLDISKKLLEDLKERLIRILKRIMSKWKNMLVALKDGAISGFVSNLITFIVNNFATTVKRFIRAIREGFHSLMEAYKFLFHRPSEMSEDEAIRLVIKSLTSVAATTVGIALENAVNSFLQTIPLLGQFASTLTPAIIGIISGISIALISYYVDRIFDLFNQDIQHFNILVTSGGMHLEYQEKINIAMQEYVTVSESYQDMISLNAEIIYRYSLTNLSNEYAIDNNGTIAQDYLHLEDSINKFQSETNAINHWLHNRRKN